MKRKAPDDKQRTISSFFAAASTKTNPAPSTHQQLHRALHQQNVAHAPHDKRRKSVDDVDIIEIDKSDDHDDEHAAGAHADHTSAVSADAPPPSKRNYDAAATIPTTRNYARHSKAQVKLVGAPGASSLAEPGAPTAAAAAAVIASGNSSGMNSSRKQQPPKYTPLEQQVVALKAANPGVLLVIEVGYKFRFFGEDAQVAAAELGLYCFPDHNFLTASFPVQRLPVHVRRLVAAGYKVGVVRQVESAALKAVSDNRSAPFTRSLTGLYSAATLDAAEKADKLGEASAMEDSQQLEAMLAHSNTAAAAAANYMIIIAEQQQQQHDLAAAAAAAQHSSSSSRSGTGLLGVLAVDVGSGDIAYGMCSSTIGSSSSGSGVVVPLEAVLLSLSPAEIVICEPVSEGTQRQLMSYMAGCAGRRCRLERVQQQQQQQRSGSSSSGDLAAASDSDGAYLTAATLQKLKEFYRNHSSTNPAEDASTATAAAAAAPAENDIVSNMQSNSQQDHITRDNDLQFILSLPQLVLVALAGAITHLTPYGLARVLKCTSGFRSLAAAGSNMLLDGNVLRQLEVLAAGGDGPLTKQGSLLHLIDRSATAAGSRTLGRWLAAPLANRTLINDRQEAVAALLAAAAAPNHVAGSSSSSDVLQRLPVWLKSLKQDFERSLSRVAAATAAPAEAVGLWTALAKVPHALHLPVNPETQHLDIETLAAAVGSRLLVSLLAAAASSAAVAAAAQVLSWLDGAAAAKNDYLTLFKSEERFPQVFSCAAAVVAAEAHLHALLPQLAAAAGVPNLNYVTIQNQGSWMVELPANRTDIHHGWVKVCGTKKVCRYHAPSVKAAMAALARAQERQAAAAQTAWQQLLAEFTAQHHAVCREAVAAVAQLDALQSLASLAASSGYTRPQFVDESADEAQQQLYIKDGKHPMLDLQLGGAAVGNSLQLSWDGTRAAVITGPNMGGKSVLIRQAALTIILAQLGSWVPAAACTLSVFDGVLSRMGATDNFVTGRSTFAEELADASNILNKATNRSFVIMDELGRGTATHDGVAIAAATLHHLVQLTHCLTLFVTHYPEVAAMAGSSSSSSSGNHIAVYHMSYIRDDAAAGYGAAGAVAATAAAAVLPRITFLYKLTAGAADASFGLNVAQMAGLPASVIQRAAAIAAQLKARLQQQQQQQQQPAAAAAAEAAEQSIDLQEQQQQEQQLLLVQQLFQQLAAMYGRGTSSTRRQQQQQLEDSAGAATAAAAAADAGADVVHQQLISMQSSVMQWLQSQS